MDGWTDRQMDRQIVDGWIVVGWMEGRMHRW